MEDNVKATLYVFANLDVLEELTCSAEAVELKRKIEAAQKDARDGVDASMKDKVHTHAQEQKAKLKSTVNTGVSHRLPLE